METPLDQSNIKVVNTSEFIPETGTTNEAVISVQSQLKKMTHKERCILLEKIAREEYEEHKEQQAKKLLEEQERIKNAGGSSSDASANPHNPRQQSQMCAYGMQMNAILGELRGLRLQIQELKLNQSVCLQQQQQKNKIGCFIRSSRDLDDEYESLSEECSLFSFEWMPIWIFLAFVLFALTVKPRKFCSMSSMPSMPIIPDLSEFCTKL